MLDPLPNPEPRSADAADAGSPLQPAVRPGQSLGRPIRVGIVNNTHSSRNKRRRALAEMARVMDDYPEVAHYEVNRLPIITAAVEELADKDMELIVVSGGDGTVQAALTALLRRRRTGTIPLLAIIEGGTTNMTAGDVGSEGVGGATLREVLDQARCGRLEGKLVTRRIMEVHVGGITRFGMFFGAAAVYHGIKYFHQRILRAGVQGLLGPAMALGTFLGSAAIGRADSILPPTRADGAVDGRRLEYDTWAVLFASTLDHLFFGIRPFWGTESGALRFTGARWHPNHLLRAMRSLLVGRPNRLATVEHGYCSHNAEEIELRLEGGFTIDGELFDSHPGEVIRLRADVSAFFLGRNGR